MITLEIKDTEVTQALTRLGALLDDLSLVMADIGQQLVFSTKERMVAGKAVDGTPFAPRQASTLAAYEKRGLKPGPQPLWLTGTMRQNIHHSYGPDSVRVASGAIQSAVMQFGAEQGQFGASIGKDKLGRDHMHHMPWGRIAARPFLGVSAKDRADILDIVGEAIRAVFP